MVACVIRTTGRTSPAEVLAGPSGLRRSGFTCEHCGQTFGDPWYRGPSGHLISIRKRIYRTDSICVECFFDAHIPSNYARREMYVDGIATRRPRLGVGWLDEHFAGRASALPPHQRTTCRRDYES
ncbi:MAG: hypothetical protein ABFD92_09260 [Planctomycetaceae bacterium]|nr:hypothetical protein [Planctomycetaceae bacterium]